MDDSGTSHKYAYLDQLSTEELEEILRADIESPESGDEAMIFYILEVIQKREQKNPTGRLADVNAAWEEFQTVYNTPEGADCSLYPMIDLFGDEDEPGVPPELLQSANHVSEPSRTTARSSRVTGVFLKRIVPVAAALLILVAAMITAQAAGLDVFGALAKWTDDTFHFVIRQGGDRNRSSDESHSNSEGTAEEYRDIIQAALEEYGFEGVQAPSWFPEGYVMEAEPEISKSKLGCKITFSFERSEQHILLIQYRDYDFDIYLELLNEEKNPADILMYVTNGRLFHIVTNHEEIKAVWCDEKSMVISISGYIAIENLYEILESMGA